MRSSTKRTATILTEPAVSKRTCFLLALPDTVRRRTAEVEESSSKGSVELPLSQVNSSIQAIACAGHYDT
jgi:hypothetical protein